MPTHSPLTQEAPTTQNWSVAHGVASGSGSGTQPIAGSQRAELHSSATSAQLRSEPPVQAPLRHSSPLVQKSPSSHGSPFSTIGSAQSLVRGARSVTLTACVPPSTLAWTQPARCATPSRSTAST